MLHSGTRRAADHGHDHDHGHQRLQHRPGQRTLVTGQGVAAGRASLLERLADLAIGWKHLDGYRTLISRMRADHL
ncbi:hypothetical protein [Streptomyces sp. NPDC096013]|uniref:hypothetical protein n=1 Tax=Streptomyces sp. NPDC096013 TaxID=3366069 RepID=UPI003802ED2A